MKKLFALGLGLFLIGGLAYAQGVKQLATLTGNEQVTGIGSPCTTSCYATTAQIGALAGLKSGTFTANSTTAVVVSDARITANSVIMFGMKTFGGTPAGTPYESAARVVGTSFTVKAGSGDTSVYNYVILN